MTDKRNGFRFSYVIEKTVGKGLGAFADKAIKKGSIVWRHVPGQYVVYDEQTFRAAIDNLSHAEVIYELTHIFGLEDFPGCIIKVFDDGALINHSSNANLVTNNSGAIRTPLDMTSPEYLHNVTEALLDDRYALVATRDIAKGEEFTNNYVAEIVDPPFFDVLCEQYGVNDDFLDDH